MRLFLFFILTGLNIAVHANTITPPKGWECITDKDQLPEKVKRVYIGSGKSQFTPSINLSSETTELNGFDYIKLAQMHHESQGDTQCKYLGKLKTLAGEADLIQIDRPTHWGHVRFLQAALVEDQTAYVLTATCLKSEFPSLSAQLLRSLQSFSLKN